MVDGVSANLTKAAKSIPLSKRIEFLEGLKETDLHRHLKRLLERKILGALVEITHGSTEYGKDLVLIDNDGLSERVAAFVVKVGKVGGKSAGVVDEIVSQVNQCFTHTITLRADLGAKSVNQVYVVIAGTASSGARKRINNEVRGRVLDIWDIRKLVDEFTEHYPEVFYEAATLDVLQRRITELESHTLFAKVGQDKNLSEWFVDPFVSSAERVERLDRSVPRQVTTHAFVKLADILRRKRRILLVGEPGSGKSAIVSKLAIDMMQEAFKKATVDNDSSTGIPILITAKQVALYPDVESMLIDQFGPANSDKLSVSALLVDGLDETGSGLRDTVLERSRDFADELKCDLIVTTRWTEAFREPIAGFHQVQVLEFRVNQALRLFEKLVPEGNLLNSLREGLDLVQNQLHMTPLTLVLLIEVVREFQEIPASVTELYDRFFDYALGRHDKDKGIEVLFAYQLKRKFLGELAHRAFFSRDLLAIPREVFEQCVEAFCHSQGIEDRNRFSDEMERSNILRHVGDEIEFVHRSFLDYFVAVELHRDHSDPPGLRSKLVELYFKARWSEVTFFYVGISRDADPKLLDEIFDCPSEGVPAKVMKLLAGRLLQAGWMAPTDIQRHATLRALSEASPTRDQILELFGSQGERPANVLGDVLLLMLGRMSFGSSFLRKSNELVLNELLAQPNYENLMRALLIVGGLRDKVSEDELDEILTRMLTAMDTAQLDSAAEMRLLAVLAGISEHDAQKRKVMERRLMKLIGRYNELAKTLFLGPKRRRRQ